MKTSSIEARKWAERIQTAEMHPGGYAGYCREYGIPEHQLYYQRKKARANRSQSLGQAVGVRKASVPAFVPVVLDPPSSSLPNAKWVAELIVHLSQAAR